MPNWIYSINILILKTWDLKGKKCTAKYALLYHLLNARYYYSIDDLRPNGLNNLLFANTIKSDGFTVDFLFEKRRASAAQELTNDIKSHDLALEDFEYEEIEKIYRPCFLDPGRKSVYTAAIGLNFKQHQLRRCTTKEYYHFTGSTSYLAKLEKKKSDEGIKVIESAIPTSKTTSPNAYFQYVNYILTNKDVFFTFYGYQTAKDRFNLYQGRQRAPEMMANLLLHGGTKYNRKKRCKKSKMKEKRKQKKNKRKKKKEMERAKGKHEQQQIIKYVKAYYCIK